MAVKNSGATGEGPCHASAINFFNLVGKQQQFDIFKPHFEKAIT
jgi:hypothetical protein